MIPWAHIYRSLSRRDYHQQQKPSCILWWGSSCLSADIGITWLWQYDNLFFLKYSRIYEKIMFSCLSTFDHTATSLCTHITQPPNAMYSQHVFGGVGQSFRVTNGLLSTPLIHRFNLIPSRECQFSHEMLPRSHCQKRLSPKHVPP